MKMRRMISLILVLCLSMSLLIGCGNKGDNTGDSNTTNTPSDTTNTDNTDNTDSKDDNEDKSDILIGVSTAITGSSPLDGERTTNGVQLAVDEINAKGGVLGGRKLKLVIEDDQNLGNIAVTVANKMMSEEIVAMLGPQKSSSALAVIPVAEQYQVPMLSGGTSPKLIESQSPYFFRLRASDTLVASIAAKFCLEEFDAKKIGVLYNNDDYGTGALGVIEEYLTGLNIPYVKEGHNTGDKDSTGQILKMKDEGVDAVIVWTHAPEMAVIARQIEELGLDVPIVGSVTTSNPDFLNLTDGSAVKGLYSVCDFSIEDEREMMQNYVKVSREKFDMDPDMFMTTYYDGVYLIADAIERAGSTDREAVRKALSETNGYEGIIAERTCNEFGELVHEAVVLQMDENKEAHLIKKVVE